MTLCVAWKWADPNGDTHIYFAADTCVTLHPSEMAYGGIKIAAIPVLYSGPRDSATGQQSQVTLTYGFAFSGEYLAAFLVRELCSQVLVHLQGIDDPSILNFDRICAVVSASHRRLHREIRENLTRGEAVEFFFGGFCPASKRVRVAKFSTDPKSGIVGFSETLTRAVGESFETIGSPQAQTRFRELIALNLEAPPCRIHFAMFRRLRDVILDPKIPSVGGAIQCGGFAPGSQHFELLGAGMTEVNEHGIEVRNFLGGTNLKNFDTVDPLALHVHPTIALPFQEDLGTFAAGSSFWTREHKRVVLDELITVLPHDPQWLTAFAAARKTLRRIFGRTVAIEHIGSTAIPGLPAVPILDIFIATHLPAEDSVPMKQLAEQEYEYLGADLKVVRPGFRKRTGMHVNLFFAPPRAPVWEEALSLREFLRSDQEARKAYGAEKVRILNTRAGTLEAYNLLKAGTLAALRAKAANFPVPPVPPIWKFWAKR